MTDSEVARRIGIPTGCVTAKRRLLKIPGLLRRNRRRPPRRFYEWNEEAMALLGTMTDREVAERFDLSPGAVRLKRISLGIAPCRRGEVWRQGIWTDEVVARLGKERCSEIARDIGVSSERVRQKCKELGIATYAAVARGRAGRSG